MKNYHEKLLIITNYFFFCTNLYEIHKSVTNCTIFVASFISPIFDFLTNERARYD